jgi:TRAP-type C4-dicarboxylate transport system substrate-binding protein
MELKKRFVLLGTALCVLALVLPAVACDGDETGPTATPQQTFEWDMQTTETPGMMSYDKVFPEFVQAVEDMSNGRLKITLHPNGALVPEREIHDAVGEGIVQMGFSTGAFWAGTVPAGLLSLGLPLSCETMEEMEVWLWDRGVVEVLREAYAEQNVYYLSPVIGMPYGSTMSKEPIETLADLEGKKIRSIAFFKDIWQQVGAIPVDTEITELYTAIATGDVDGANMGNADRFYSLKLYDVAKYYTMPPLSTYAGGEFIVNMDKWNELPDDLQAILLCGAKRASTQFAVQAAYGADEAMTKMVQDHGVVVNTFSDEDIDTLREISVGIWDGIAQMSEYNAEIVEITKEYMRYLGRLD